jgi:hypothetical protein
MTGAEYAALNRWSLDDLRSLASVQIAGATRLLNRPLVAQTHMDLAEQTADLSLRRRHYIAAYREARFEMEHLPAANGLFEVVLPKDIKNELDELKASFEVVNQTAKGKPAWDEHYQEFQQFYERNKDPGWLSSSYATITNIRERAQRLEDWKKQLAAEGVKILDPEKKPPGNPVKDTLDSATVAVAVGLGALLLLRRDK